MVCPRSSSAFASSLSLHMQLLPRCSAVVAWLQQTHTSPLPHRSSGEKDRESPQAFSRSASEEPTKSSLAFHSQFCYLSAAVTPDNDTHFDAIVPGSPTFRNYVKQNLTQSLSFPSTQTCLSTPVGSQVLRERHMVSTISLSFLTFFSYCISTLNIYLMPSTKMKF